MGEDVVAPGHRPASIKHGADLDRLRDTYEGLGKAAVDFLSGLERAKSRSAAYHARNILTLRDRYSTDDLVAALTHALSYGAYDHHAVSRILQMQARPRRLDEYVAEETVRRLQRIVGDSRTEPRQLSEYDKLPCWSTPQASQGEQTCQDPSRQEPPADGRKPVLSDENEP